VPQGSDAELLDRDAEARIATNPRDIDAYIDYGEWLRRHGSPRGELIALQHALTQSPDDRSLVARILDHLREHWTFYLGEFDWSQCPFGRKREAFLWNLGFITEAHLSFDPDRESKRSLERGARALGELLDRLSGRLLRNLTVGVVCEDEAFATQTFQPVIDAIASRERPALRSLGLHARNADTFLSTDDDDDTYPGELGDLGGLWSAVAEIEHLRLQSSELNLGSICLPKLRTAQISVWHPEECGCLAALAGAQWPRLERLALYLGCHAYGAEATAEEVIRIVDATRLPALKELGLFGFASVDRAGAGSDAFVELLVDSPIASQLETLAILGDTLSASGAECLVKNRAALRSLKRLRIDHPFLGSDKEVGAKELIAALQSSCSDAIVESPSLKEYFWWRNWFRPRSSR
jgi:uncharacterized protein (TIGR02996 family)